MSARGWYAVYAAAFAVSFGVTWIVSGDVDRENGDASVAAADAPGIGRSVVAQGPRTRKVATPIARPVKVVEVAPALTLEQQMIRDYGLPAKATWAAVRRAVLDLLNSKVELAYRGDDPTLPWDCGDGLSTAEPPTAVVHVRATPERVVASGYRVTSPNVAPEVAECLEAYFAGEAIVEANPHVGAFLELETTIEQPAY